MNIMNATDCYRLGVLAELARHYPAPVTARAVARTRKIPLPYLAQLVRDLGRRGLVNTRRGPGGGLTLARPAAEISLTQVLDWEAAHQSIALQTPQHKEIVELFLASKKGKS